ncbi:hypothetical protein Tco_0223021 [Tanacetum coccineum]
MSSMKTITNMSRYVGPVSSPDAVLGKCHRSLGVGSVLPLCLFIPVIDAHRKAIFHSLTNRTVAPQGEELGLMKPLSVSSCSCSASSFISDGVNLYGARAIGVAPVRTKRASCIVLGLVAITMPGSCRAATDIFALTCLFLTETSFATYVPVLGNCPPWHCMGSFISSGLNVGIPPYSIFFKPLVSPTTPSVALKVQGLASLG